MSALTSLHTAHERSRSRKGVEDRVALDGAHGVHFLLAILGFSFWFFLAVPFASHRETYSWLAGSVTQTLSEQFSFGLSSTYRPASQAVIFLLFRWLDPNAFPTSPWRQAVLQCLVYACFVLAWWLVYRAATHRRTFAVVALISGAVLFSGYVHLFHIYGLMYVPVILTLATMLLLLSSGRVETYAPWLAAATSVLVLWHPFAAAVFVACYAGFALEVFRSRPFTWTVKTVVTLAVPTAAVLLSVVLFARDTNALGSRLDAFMASYRTNEVNVIASAAVLMLGCLTAASMTSSLRASVALMTATIAAGAVFIASGFPVLLLWFGIVLAKLYRLRLWSLFLLMVAMTLLPFGGATGTPIHTLFAIVVATYVTACGWDAAERTLTIVKPPLVVAAIGVAAVVAAVMRTGAELPVLSRVASPLLAERERTYQLEQALEWLRESRYCSSSIAFVQESGSPVDSIENAVNRQNRPPAAIQDVRFFWDTVLRCRPQDDRTTAIVTFGGPAVAGGAPVYQLAGTHAEDATVWIGGKR